MYQPVLNRFLSRDPLPPDGQPDILYDNNWFGDRMTWMRNTYGYASNNPVNRVDPSGLQDDVLVPHKNRLPEPTDQCGAAFGSMYWSIKSPTKGFNGWIIQGMVWNYKVKTCNNEWKENTVVFYFEAWQVKDGIVYDGFKNAGGTNLMPPMVDRWKIADRGDTKGFISIAGCVQFIKDFDLKTPPWKKPGEGGHMDIAPGLPTLVPKSDSELPAGYKVSLAKCRAMLSKWDCCCNPIEETEVLAGGWE